METLLSIAIALCAGLLVSRFVKPLKPLFDIEVREQLARDARVFRTYHIGRAQLIERAQRDIAQIADGRRT